MIAAAFAAAAPGSLRRAQAAEGTVRMTLIRQGLESRSVNLAAIGDRALVHLDEAGVARQVELSECIALYDPTARPQPQTRGLLLLADGQRLPGEAAAGAEEGALGWQHPWLGRLDVPLDSVRTLRLAPGAVPPPPGDQDQVLLANGDLLGGFLVSLADPLQVEIVDEPGSPPRVVDVPLELVAAVTMVTPQRAASGRRVWFRDGTVLEVSEVRAGDDGFVRISSPWLISQTQATQLRIEQVAAILFAPDAMTPLSTLPPAQVSGPPTRYVIPPPALDDPDAPLGLATITCEGPLTVRYALPAGTRRFAAEALLPPPQQAWGDYELIVMDDDKPVFRARLNGERPALPINVAISGAELTIQMTPGKYGPVQDRLVLRGAMLGR